MFSYLLRRYSFLFYRGKLLKNDGLLLVVIVFFSFSAIKSPRKRRFAFGGMSSGAVLMTVAAVKPAFSSIFLKSLQTLRHCLLSRLSQL